MPKKGVNHLLDNQDNKGKSSLLDSANVAIYAEHLKSKYKSESPYKGAPQHMGRMDSYDLDKYDDLLNDSDLMSSGDDQKGRRQG